MTSASKEMTAGGSPGPGPTGTAAPAAPLAPAQLPYWGPTLVLLAGTFIAVLDFFIVNVAVPSIQRDLHANSANIEWIVAGFAITYGSGLIIGRLGDIYGRRRLYMTGLTLFVLSSALCGAAPNITVLITGRLIQGAAAALLSPQILTIIRTALTGRQQLRAFSAYGVTMGLAAVFAQLIGGVLIRVDPGGLTWRSCFYHQPPDRHRRAGPDPEIPRGVPRPGPTAAGLRRHDPHRPRADRHRPAPDRGPPVRLAGAHPRERGSGHGTEAGSWMAVRTRCAVPYLQICAIT